MSRKPLYRAGSNRPWGAEPGLEPDFVPRTESEEARRAARDWLRDRNESDAMSFAEERGGVFADYDGCSHDD